MPFIDLNPPSGGGGVNGDATVTIDGIFPSSLTIGDVVYISADKTGSYYNVDKADRASLVKMPAIGILISKITSTTGLVLLHGEITGLYTGLTPNAVLFVSSSSTLTETPPGSPISGISVSQIMGKALASDVIHLSPLIPIVRSSM